MIIALPVSIYCPEQSYHDTVTNQSYWIPTPRVGTLHATPMKFIIKNGVKVLQPPCFTKK